MKKLTYKDLKNKTIKQIEEYYDGILILFTDKMLISIAMTQYPEGGFADCIVEEIIDDEDYNQKTRFLADNFNIGTYNEKIK